MKKEVCAKFLIRCFKIMNMAQTRLERSKDTELDDLMKRSNDIGRKFYEGRVITDRTNCALLYLDGLLFRLHIIIAK